MTLILADTHVHLYRGMPLPEALLGAAANMQMLTRRYGLPESAFGALFLTERQDCDAFHEIQQLRDPRLRVTVLSGSELAVSFGGSGMALRIIAGRQVATTERLEVLALNTLTQFPAGLSLPDALRAVQEAGGFPVLNWSLGKWLGSRGKRVRQAVESLTPGEGSVADVIGRPWGWPTPGIFRCAARRNLPILAGTDPLPLAGEERFIGRFVTATELPDAAGTIAETEPVAAQLIARWCATPRQLRTYGTRLSPAAVGSRALALRQAQLYPPPRPARHEAV